MATPYSISFGPWIPDGLPISVGLQQQYAPTALPLVDVSNVYWSDRAYRALSAPVNQGTALGTIPLGAFTAIDTSGNPQIYVGDPSDLWHWNGSGFTKVSKAAGAYAGTAHWSFAEFGGCIIAANGINVMQDMAIGGSAFADVTGAPTGSVLGVIGQFLLVGDITTGSFPYRVMWSGIGDPTSWPTPLTDAAIAAQSGQEDLTQEFGRVLFIAGGPQIGVVFQQNGLTRLTYQGGDTVFSFVPFERKRGLLTRGGAVQVGDVTHFLASDGFCMTDGTQVVRTGATSDGNTSLDRWFFANVNMAAISTMWAAWDSALKNVCFGIPTGSNTHPDTMLFYNPTDERWSKAPIATYIGWADNTGTTHRLGTIDQTQKLSYLTGGSLSAYCETWDGGFLDGMVRDVVEVQPMLSSTGDPTVRIGYKEGSNDPTTYTTDNSPDAFSRRVTFDPPPAGRFVRARMTAPSTSNAVMQGVTLYTEMGGV